MTIKSTFPIGVLLSLTSLVVQLYATPVELLIKWKDGPESDAAALRNAELGSIVLKNLSSIGWQTVRLTEGLTSAEALRAYRNFPEVISIEANAAFANRPPVEHGGTSARLAMLTALSSPRLPNDPRFKQQWYLNKVSAPRAWEVSTGSSSVVVAIIDTGINYNHPDLAGNMWHNPGETGVDASGRDKATNGIDDDGNGYIDDVFGIDLARDERGRDSDPNDEGVKVNESLTIYHGTACAGVIGGVGNNGNGIAGINWTVQLMAIRWCNNNNVGYTADVIAAFDYVIAMKRRGVNIRVTNNSYYTEQSEALRDALDACAKEGILNVFAAANAAQDIDTRVPFFPGAYDSPSVISVARTDTADQLYPSSNWGRTSVDLAAPGSDLTTTSINDSYIDDFSGTSAAAPVVAGAAALLLAVNPNLPLNDLRAALFGSVDPVASLKGKVVTNGRLNIGRAIEYLTNTRPPFIVLYAKPGGQRTSPNAPIQVAFSTSVNPESIESSFNISPAVSGSFEWAPDHRSFLFHPSAALNPRTNYTARIQGTSRDEAGQTLDGNFNRVAEGSPADDFVWTFRFPLPNDDFQQAESINSDSGVVKGNNSRATSEADEPLYGVNRGASLWYRWNGVADGWFTFELTPATAFDSFLAIYTGDRIDQLLPVASNDNYGTRSNSRLSFPALAGTNYSITVASVNIEDKVQTGGFTLVWYPTPAPGFTGSQFLPTMAAVGATITLSGTNFTGATAVLFNGVSSSFANAPTNNRDLRITATVPFNATSGPITVLTPHGNVTSTALFTVVRPTVTIARNSPHEFILSWADPTFTLQASADLRRWSALAPSGVTTTTVTSIEKEVFFRLVKP